ncbi:hypothetical protein B0H16DRAFT_1712585 [Mycena metata]|uniref:Uncharacterized protein n=1 Tax=Mycena metata TaxID=1033252 RepID=A0AAD7NUX8_9AGAR|nr:hypothetical protein B0H16DRAFT_1712585 [Mycena metata]
MSLAAKLLKQMTPSPSTLDERQPYVLPGYIDPHTGFEGCGVPFYAPPHWMESYHSTKGYWVVTRHEKQGIYTKSSWALDVEGPDVYLQYFATKGEALHCMAKVCAREHTTACRVRNGDRPLGPYHHPHSPSSYAPTTPTESGITTDASFLDFLGELAVAEGEYGIVPGDGNDAGDEHDSTGAQG